MLPPPRLVRIALAGALVGSSATGACGEAPGELVLPVTTSGAGIAGAPPGDGGGGGAGGEDGAGGGGGDAGGAGATPAVLVGLHANPVRAGEDPPSRIDEVEAAASAYAAGARVAAVKRRWAAADRSTLTGDAELARAGCAPDDRCRAVAVTIAVVDGALDGRPEELADLPWSAPATRAALNATIDDVLDVFGDDLAVLALGARVDRWIVLHGEDEGALRLLLGGAVARATERGRDGLLVGVGVSGDGALASAGPAVALRELGTATMASLFPGLHDVADGGSLPSPAAAAQVLDAIDGVAPGRPVALVEVGYPSAAVLGGSEDAQAVFFGSLFAALDSRRASFPIVAASRLHDLDDAACAAEGAELGEDDPLVRAYRCSTGVRSAADEPKLAWTSVLAGTARLASGGGTGPGP